MTMTDPLEGTRTFRLQVAGMALAEFEDYTESRGRYADQGRPLGPAAVGGLANAAAWLIEMLEHQAPAGGPRMTGHANKAIAHLDSRQLRDVLNVLAVRDPAAVLAAIAETGA
jgi:hypothetical protein